MNSETPFRIFVESERKVAYSSPDHQIPWGTRRDNSKNYRFNLKLYKLFSFLKRPIKILDLGCSGGGFVKDCIDDGCLAVGLEGSNYSKTFGRAEWRTIPDFLFTTDITGKFDIFIDSGNKKKSLTFDAVTSWEVLEHIAEKDMAAVTNNVKRHLEPGGLWIVSISPNEEIIDGIRLHQTVKPKKWWISKFGSLGFYHMEEYVRYFNTQFIRGPKYGAPGSFHLVLTQDKSKSPKIPSTNLIDYLIGKWIGSRYQQIIKKVIIG